MLAWPGSSYGNNSWPIITIFVCCCHAYKYPIQSSRLCTDKTFASAQASLKSFRSLLYFRSAITSHFPLAKKAGPMELGEGKSSAPKAAVNRGVAILDFILRILAFIGTLGSAISMATTNETLPFFTQFIRFRAEYDDLPTFTFFVVANGVVSAYLLFSLPLSIFNIVRSKAQNSRILLIILDTAMLGLLSAGASAAAAIVYLAHHGNVRTNWPAICQQFNSFCERTSGSLIGSFIGVVVLILLIALSAVALSRHK